MCRTMRRLAGAHQRVDQLALELIAVRNQRVVTRAVSKHAKSVHPGTGRLLQRLFPERGQGWLSGDHQQRNAIVVGAGDAGQQVGRTGPRSRAADADLPRLSGVAIGHEGGTRLVSRQHRSRPAASLAACQCIVERLDGATGNAEDIFNAELFEIGNDQVGHFGRSDGVCSPIAFGCVVIMSVENTRIGSRSPQAGEMLQ